MKLSLIGMAGSGKSYWSCKLAQHYGFKRLWCDDMIAEKLAPELKACGYNRMTVAQWMGFPYETHYKEREEKYLACEREVMMEIIDQLESKGNEAEQDIVVDTTGSVIYAGDTVLRRLGQCTTVVLLSTPPEVQKQLLEDYLSHPHPMVWRNMFEQRPHESPLEALQRCYPHLFKSREVLYKKYAHVTIDYYERRQKGFTAKNLLEQVHQAKYR